MSLRRRLKNRAVHRLRDWVEEAGSIRPGTDAADAFAAFGEASLVAFPFATVAGEESMSIGTRTLIGRSATLMVGYGPLDTRMEHRELVIGDRCVIGARATITAHDSIRIGDDVWFGQGVFVSDASHGYQDPDVPIGMQFGTHQPVTIGSGTWIGHGAVILPGTHIGRNVVVGAGSVVRGEVEDHAVVVGAPARVVRRRVPGVGWLADGDPLDVRPEWTAADLDALVAGEI